MLRKTLKGLHHEGNVVYSILLSLLSVCILFACQDDPQIDILQQTETATQTQQKTDAQLIATLRRYNINRSRFHVPKEMIDPITTIFAHGRGTVTFVFTSEFGNSQIEHKLEPLPNHTRVHRWHYPLGEDISWYRITRIHPRKNEKPGFAFNIDLSPDPNGVREFFFFPEFGTSMDGFFGGGPGAPTILKGVTLKIYYQDD